ncbi:endoplasmic reticulum metallopeptidase 1-like [Drosophila sulfurigaster albostrigata]|uniref:endoplasmic reticulum metallopeptidase 1-like n=1 Tax=Drosophila sulfurigaster albostrigata TaxID=89887 RepID=UPI002D21CD53|nr:endoplasmic reticulum metallopeptidase 1-like [Drosophila sulfurigaster albostrigata]
MSDKEKLITQEYSSLSATRNDKNGKLPWYFASGFLLFWGLLFFAIVIPLLYRLPTALTLEDADRNVYIAERAYKDLYGLSNLGTKLIGSKENEVDAVEFLLQKLNQIKEDSLKEYFDIEIDLSQASGEFSYSDLLNKYQGVQNIAVKFSCKNSTSQTWLLVNSHFDSKPDTPSAGDAGFMIVTMLEVLRVMSTTRQTFEHPIVFLFNGAEEAFLLASHGFMTTHRWAPYLKACVNLDAAGSGSRELLFQTSPNHPWLVNYYYLYAKHPFGTTLAEEIYQSGIVPSDSDFTNFKEYMPGMDFGQVFNGYIYHTKYDTIDVIPREAFQNTGDNALSIIRALSNATELRDTEAHKTGNVIFFDFLGLYFFHYSASTGQSLNYGIAGTALALVFISMWRMAAVSQVSICYVIKWYFLVQVMQIISFVLGLIIPIVVTYVLDSYDRSLTYYSNPLLLIGLYVCPSLLGLSLPITFYYSLQQNNKISAPYHLQLALHSQAVILAVLTITLTSMGIRSTYIFMIPLLFYVISLMLNLMTVMHDLGYAWTGLLKLSQVAPFLYSSYLMYLFIVVLTPMGARGGSASNADLTISVLAALGTVLSFGFLVPLINTFRRPSLVIFTLLASTALTIYLASSTQVGFPYRAKTSGLRVAFLHSRNRFYEYDGSLSKEESGYFFSFQDRREEKALDGTDVDLTGLVSVESKCYTQMMCGMPMYHIHFVNNRLQSKWLPRSEPIVLPGTTKLELLSKTIVNTTTVRLEFNLTGPPQTNLYFQAFEDVTIINWSFTRKYLEESPAYPLSYHVHFNYGNDSSPLNFYLELYKWNGNFNVGLIQVGVVGHYIGFERDEHAEKFASTFPKYAILSDWATSYDRYIY